MEKQRWEESDGKAEVGRVREEKVREEKRRDETRREEKRRREKIREREEKESEERVRRKSQKKESEEEDAGAQKGRKVAISCVFLVICGSGRSKRRLAKAAGAGAEPFGQMSCQKSAPRCGTKHISKSK